VITLPIPPLSNPGPIGFRDLSEAEYRKYLCGLSDETLVQEGEAAESRLSQDGRSTVSIRTEAEVVQGGLQEEASKIAVFSPFATM
jgi:hypothetical protein